jgi:DNA-binding HxlR family transcriptional regulator
MALGAGPLRTKELTERVPGYSPRSIYRHAAKLAELGVVDRVEEPGVPSKVVYRLSGSRATELYELVDRFADVALMRLPDGQVASYAWVSLGLLADLWESRIVRELACDVRSPTELARGEHEFSYHQVNRRAGLLARAGFLREEPGPGRQRFYGLAEQGRRSMALIAGIGRWRHHHVVAEDEGGLTTEEMATLLGASLPLVEVPQHVGKCLRLDLFACDAAEGDENEAVWAEVEDDGALHSCPDPTPRVDGWACGGIEDWVPVPLEGDSTRLIAGGDIELVDDVLSELHEVLWTPASECAASSLT